MPSFSFSRSVLTRERLRRLLPVGRVELAQIASHALLQLRPAPFYLAACEVLVAIVHRLELATVDGHARFRQQSHLAAQLDELRTDLLDGWPVVLAEIGNGLVVGREPPQEPDDFQIAAGLTSGRTDRLPAGAPRNVQEKSVQKGQLRFR